MIIYEEEDKGMEFGREKKCFNGTGNISFKKMAKYEHPGGRYIGCSIISLLCV